MSRIVAQWLVCALLAWLPMTAQAINCSADISDVNFGNVDALSDANPLATTTATMTVTCNATTLLELFFGVNGGVCLNIGPGTGGSSGSQRTLLNGTSTLNYSISSDPNGTDSIGATTAPQFGQPQLYRVGNGTQTFTLYGRLAGNQPNALTGNYSSSFASAANAQLRVQAGNNVNCANAGGTASNLSFSAIATVTPMCLLDKPADLNFGARDNLATDIDANTTISLRCTRGASYTIALNDGVNGARNMRLNGGADLVRYALFRDATRTLPWGTGANIQAGTGTAVSQSLTVYGRVPSQTTPAVGAFTDTVTVTVTF